MKKYALLFAVLVTVFPALKADQNYPRAQDKAALYRSICERYYPTGLILLEFDKEQRYENIDAYVDGSDLISVVYDMPTYMHETFHAYENRMPGTGWNDKGFMLDGSVKFAIPMTEIYDTRELHKIVPRRYREEIFRYSPYIYDTDNNFGGSLGSHVQGLYGLLEEWNAYYLESRMVLDMMPWFVSQCDDTDLDCWSDLFIHNASIFMAQDEFRIFAGWYLRQARLKHPEIYRGMMRNQRFRLAFTMLDNRFGQTVKDYEAALEALAVRMSKNGYSASVDEEFFYRTRDGYSSGTGHYLDDIRELRRIFEDEGLEPELEAFRLPNFSESEWRDYL